MTKEVGSGSGTISQMHGSADPDPDPHQNVDLLPGALFCPPHSPFGWYSDNADSLPLLLISLLSVCLVETL
jgi:hypothetical protein